ncbi:hypothetical protein CDL15_Pgr000298 [Punica granatum]|uniref:Receptor-like serine/threonine-protein kinase n=1 Tax=Punica granatum TaxID=22663 RepID=A0A218Y2C0_PUNGR|nr:hypothetical protein CDL15_Pgr000298 [Punica granatum]
MSEDETLISPGGKFQLGFFSTDNSSKRYLGIWFYDIRIRTIIWVANRNKPLESSPGLLKIEHGNLVIQNHSGQAIWASNTQNLSSSSTTAKLLDSGNLVLKYGNSESYLWQSFNHPTDTMLTGMKVGWDFKAGMEKQLMSWKSALDPSLGQFSFKLDPSGFPQGKMFEGNITRYRSFPHFGSVHASSAYIPKLVNGSEGAYFSYDLRDKNTLQRYLLNYTGKLQHYIWMIQTLDWMLLYELPNDSCDEYAKCGPNAVCVEAKSLRTCKCLPGYVSKSAEGSDTLNPWYSGGCTWKSSFNCSGPEGFKGVKGVKLPDLLLFEMNTTMTLKECENFCSRNCTCTAYASTSESTDKDKTGCGFWFGDLLDIREANDNYRTNEIFIRVIASELEGDSKRTKWVVAVAVVLSVSSAMFCLWASWTRRKGQGANVDVHAEEEENFELPVFNAVMISQATNNFSCSNQIGKGGFGHVYKGELPNGQEIAVKRLSETSKQGLNEFKNEVMLIAKLQHRNLVKLLGCCIEGRERMLVYEYMPNGSLDSFIFSTMEGSCLAWRRRFNIIVGVARGLLYLHRDSRLTIIHRDLKGGNVLLDNKMNPKISDFGMARTFREDQLLEKTKRIVGTFGYISPEYAADGIFSIKSDVFSFGVLAWKLWVEGKAYELIDGRMEDSFPLSEVMRCIQVGLLCVQKCPEDRPTMSSVLLMLDSETATLLQPKEPGFYLERIPDGTKIISNRREYSANEISITLVDGR